MLRLRVMGFNHTAAILFCPPWPRLKTLQSEIKGGWQYVFSRWLAAVWLKSIIIFPPLSLLISSSHSPLWPTKPLNGFSGERQVAFILNRSLTGDNRGFARSRDGSHVGWQEQWNMFTWEWIQFLRGKIFYCSAIQHGCPHVVMQNLYPLLLCDEFNKFFNVPHTQIR
jgi:hypothetical protein